MGSEQQVAAVSPLCGAIRRRTSRSTEPTASHVVILLASLRSGIPRLLLVLLHGRGN